MGQIASKLIPSDDAREYVLNSSGVRALESRLLALQDENARLARLLGLVTTYKSSASAPPMWMRPKKRYEPMAATAILQLSDLHLDETVQPEEMSGLNAYSRQIAEQRLRRWAEKACEMGDMHRHKWEGVLIVLGGDMVSGAIHAELRETNADVLPGTMIHWAPRLASAISMVADFYGKAHIACVVGNHGRLTEKKQAKRRARNSWDWLLYQMIQGRLDHNRRITWAISNSDYLFVPMYGKHIYLTHGDEHYGGNGIAGVWTPLNKIYRDGLQYAAIHELQMTWAAMGHWHQRVLAPARGIVCNGAMKGYCEYARSIRAKPEPANQNWLVYTPTHGVTLKGPLFLEDRRAEGW